MLNSSYYQEPITYRLLIYRPPPSFFCCWPMPWFTWVFNQMIVFVFQTGKLMPNQYWHKHFFTSWPLPLESSGSVSSLPEGWKKANETKCLWVFICYCVRRRRTLTFRVPRVAFWVPWPRISGFGHHLEPAGPFCLDLMASVFLAPGLVSDETLASLCLLQVCLSFF